MTDKGYKLLEKAIPLWKEAEDEILDESKKYDFQFYKLGSTKVFLISSFSRGVDLNNILDHYDDYKDSPKRLRNSSSGLRSFLVTTVFMILSTIWFLGIIEGFIFLKIN